MHAKTIKTIYICTQSCNK